MELYWELPFMAPRCTSFQRGCLLILNWKSCSGSAIFLIWSLSLMKYLCLSGLIVSLCLIRLAYPSSFRSAGKTASGGRSFGPQTNIFAFKWFLLLLCVVVKLRNRVLWEKRTGEEIRRRRQTKTKRKKKYRSSCTNPAIHSSSEYIYHISHSVNSEVLYSDCLLENAPDSSVLTYCTIVRLYHSHSPDNTLRKFRNQRDCIKSQSFYGIVLYMSRDRKRVKRKRQNRQTQGRLKSYNQQKRTLLPTRFLHTRKLTSQRL